MKWVVEKVDRFCPCPCRARQVFCNDWSTWGFLLSLLNEASLLEVEKKIARSSPFLRSSISPVRLSSKLLGKRGRHELKWCKGHSYESILPIFHTIMRAQPSLELELQFVKLEPIISPDYFFSLTKAYQQICWSWSQQALLMPLNR
jgi:hypothetical protein